MKKTFTLILALSFFLPSLKAQQFAWTQKANFTPGNRAGAFAFSIGSKGYVGSGAVQTGSTISYIDDFWEYNSATDVWTQKATLPGIRSAAAGFTIGSKGYVTTGFTGSVYLNETLEYDTTANTWSVKANFPGAVRYTATVFVIGNYAYVGLGKSGGYYTDFFRYDAAADAWMPITPIGGSPRQNAKAITNGNYAYVIGGTNDNLGDFFDVWQYDAPNDTWTQKTNYPGNGSYAGIAFNLNGGYAGIGGLNSIDSTYDDFYSYDPSNDTWTPAANFGGGNRAGLTFLTIGNKGYAGMGSSTIFPVSNYQSDWWEFSDVTGINTIDKSNEIKVFVFNRSLTVKFANAIAENYQLKVFDINGKLVRRELISAGTDFYTTDLTNQPDGNYLYSFFTRNKMIKSGKISLH